VPKMRICVAGPSEVNALPPTSVQVRFTPGSMGQFATVRTTLPSVLPDASRHGPPGVLPTVEDQRDRSMCDQMHTGSSVQSHMAIEPIADHQPQVHTYRCTLTLSSERAESQRTIR
jgi:hypothetical protein